MILTPLHKVPKNVGDLGKLIVAKGFKKLPKEQKIANSGHTADHLVNGQLLDKTWLLSIPTSGRTDFQANVLRTINGALIGVVGVGRKLEHARLIIRFK